MQDSDAIKLFVGQIPKHMEEEDLRPVFEEFGEIFDLAVIRDKISGLHRGEEMDPHPPFFYAGIRYRTPIIVSTNSEKGRCKTTPTLPPNSDHCKYECRRQFICPTALHSLVFKNQSCMFLFQTRTIGVRDSCEVSFHSFAKPYLFQGVHS